MGVLNGGLRARRFDVIDPPTPLFEDLEQAVLALAFQDFSSDDVREVVMGWTSVTGSLAPVAGELLLGDKVFLTLRTDTKRIPKSLLRRQCKAMEADWKLKAGREDLTRAERDEIADVVTRRLLERALPSTQTVDLVWDTSNHVVTVLTTTSRPIENIRVLFEKTFGAKLRPVFPYTLALRSCGADHLDRLTPAAFGGA